LTRSLGTCVVEMIVNILF